MEYELLEAQREFLEIPHNYNLDVALYQGGYGSGKTWSGSLLGILLCLNIPGIRGLVGAQTFKLVRDTTLVSYFEHLDALGYKEGREYKYYKGDAKLKFKNGSEILFRHFEEPTKLKSLNLGFVEIEEMSDVPEATFNMLLGRLRQKNIDRYRIFGHTNPEFSKGWIYKTFVQKKKHNYRIIIAPTSQNIHLPEGFVENLRNAYDSEYFNINVMGNFGDYTKGLVTKGFINDCTKLPSGKWQYSSNSNVRPLKYNSDLTLHICCDFNVDPMCWVLAHIDHEAEKIYFFDEIVLENTTTEETITEFLSRYSDHKGPIIINGDASGDNRNTASEYTNYIIMLNKLKEFGYKNVEFEIKDFNPPIKNRLAAWNAKTRNALGEISILISPNCPRLIENCENVKYKPGSSIIDVPAHRKIKDDKSLKFLVHPLDAASYPVDYYFPILPVDDEQTPEKEPESVWEKYANDFNKRKA